jgi:hypothetical protein
MLQNCTDCVEGEAGSCSGTCVTCDADGIEGVSIKVEEAIDIKDEFPETFLPAVSSYWGSSNSPRETNLENRGDVERVGTLTPSILRLQLQRSELVRCHDGKGFFLFLIENIFLAAWFSDRQITMNRMQL